MAFRQYAFTAAKWICWVVSLPLFIPAAILLEIGNQCEHKAHDAWCTRRRR